MPYTFPDIKHNLTAVTVPGLTDDRDSGYEEGKSRWINVLTGKEYRCIDATPGNASWAEDLQAGIQSVAGLKAALQGGGGGGADETPSRTGISEQFTKRPAVTTDITAGITNLTDNSGWNGTHDDTLAASTAQKAGYMYLPNVLAATTTGKATQYDLTGGAGSLSGVVQPDVPRNVTLTITDGDVSISAYSITVTGTAPDGTAATETFTFADGLTPSGVVAFATITDISVDSITGAGAGDVLDIGHNNNIGLSLPKGSTSLSIIKLKHDGTIETEAGVDVTENTFTPTTVPDGAVDYEVWYEYLDAQQSVLLQNLSDTAAKVIQLVALVNALVLANADFEVAGTNMTSALVTLNAARGGIRLTTAGANNDQAILQPRLTNSNDSRWAKGFSTSQQTKWTRGFSLVSVADVSVKQALALTNAHDLTTDANQVGLYWSSATGGNFLVVTSIGGTDATIDTGVAPAAATVYILRVEIQSDRTALIYLNDAKVGHTAALTASINLLPFGSIQALTGAAKSWDCYDKDVATMNLSA